MFQVIMDRLYKGVWDKVKSGSPFSRALFQFAYEYKKNSLEKGYDTPVFNKYAPVLKYTDLNSFFFSFIFIPINMNKMPSVSEYRMSGLY